MGDAENLDMRAALTAKLRRQEYLALQIASLHNLAFYLWLVREARKHILADDYHAWKDIMVKRVMQRI